MDSISQTSEKKKGVIWKMWQRCKSLSDGIGKKDDYSLSSVQLHATLNRKDKSLPLPLPRRTTSVEKGCFPIFVGPEKERFMIKTEQVNHPLFKILLEEAESEYGYAGNHGPLMLPCDVECFVDLLIEMDCCDEGIGEEKGSSFIAATHSSYYFLTPPRVIASAG